MKTIMNMNYENAVHAEKLQCEFLINPLAIDCKNPRLSWNVSVDNSNLRGKFQSAYKIIVASNEKLLSKNIGDIWNSKKTLSGNSTGIKYNGKKLKSFKKYFWKVILWDEANNKGKDSKTATWSMGVLKKSDWKAEWICNCAPQNKLSRYNSMPIFYYRKQFRVSKPVKRVMLYSSTLGIYEPYFNGKRLGNDYLSPGWTDYNERVHYDAYDITEKIKTGNNALGFIVTNGWYAGHLCWFNQKAYYGNAPKLISQLVIFFEDGSKKIIGSDRTWLVTTGPLVDADLLKGETYDARREITDWSSAETKHQGWSLPGLIHQPKVKLEARPTQPVRIIHKYKPVSIIKRKDGAYICNFNQNIAGFVSVKLNEKAGKKITMRHAEMLNSDGSLHTDNLRTADATDVYYCKGTGTESYQPHFTFHGFQYFEISGVSKKPKPEDITAYLISSDIPRVGNFSSSNKMINKLYSNIYHTQLMNFIDVPTDCPQRDERLGWTGDAQAYIKTASMITDIQKFFEKWLVDLEIGQFENGNYPAVAPELMVGMGSGPAWAEAGIICPWVLYEVYGDTDVLKKQYNSMTRFINYLIKLSGKKLLPPKEYHCYGDWLSHNVETPKGVIYMAYFAYSVDLMSKIAKIIGKKSDAKKYEKLFENIKIAFNKKYVDKNYKIKGDTQTCYILGIAYNLLNSDGEKCAAEYLVEKIKERNYHLSTGFVGTKDIMNVLAKIGRNDTAYKLLLNTTYPSWGYSIKNGATTIWERWNAWTAEEGFCKNSMNSYAHYAYGAVYLWMIENIGGIKSITPAFKNIIIKPVPGGGIYKAKCEYKSISGKILTDWKKTKNSFKLNVEIPCNTVAKIYFPAEDKDLVKESGKQASRVVGIKFTGMENGYAVYNVGSGKYFFTS